jgi:hypothetical protein
MVPASMPAEFASLCRSLLARDPVYGRLMNEEPTPLYDGLSAMRFQYEQENAPFVLGPRVSSAIRPHHS